MQNICASLSVSSEGFLLLDSSLRPIFVNRAAAEILSYPRKLDFQKNLDAFLADKIQTALFSLHGSRMPALVTGFVSGRRRYQCRGYRLDLPANGKPNGSVAVILERSTASSFSLGMVSAKFHLTSREQEVLRHLLLGLTTKEIATRMEISPHTVKTFLRVIMLKMGVATRAAVVGKAFTAHD